MKKILIQQGHVSPRQPGFESGTGTTGEIETVSAIGLALFNLLKKDSRFQPTLCPGKVPTGWTGDVVLSLHCDGSSNKLANGYSLGWPPAEYGTKTRKMLVAINRVYQSMPGHPKHHLDNYTDDMRGYYVWHRVNAPVKILIEHGFLTNLFDRKFIKSNEKQIARAWYNAILDYFDYKPLSKTKPKKSIKTKIKEYYYERWNPPNQGRKKSG
jgi:hypothetical protein